jgi:hypothetical protein
VEEKNMRDILLDGIVVEINNYCEKLWENGVNRENGNTINDNIVFYVCGTLVNRRRRGCQDYYPTLNGDLSHLCTKNKLFTDLLLTLFP